MNEGVLVVVVVRRWRVAYAPRGSRGSGARARAARAHSGRDVTPTQRARHSPRPLARALPGPFYDSPLYLPLLLLRFIYLRSAAKQHDSAGNIGQFSEPAAPTGVNQDD